MSLTEKQLELLPKLLEALVKDGKLDAVEGEDGVRRYCANENTAEFAEFLERLTAKYYPEAADDLERLMKHTRRIALDYARAGRNDAQADD